MRKLSLFVGVCLFVLAGCGNKQDPFDGKPEALKAGHPPVEKVQTPAPADSDAVRINSVDSFTFRETVEGRFPLSVLVLEKDYNGVLEIINENEFPGAYIDPEKSEFVWNPPKGYINGGTQSDDTLQKELQLKVRAFGKHKDSADSPVFTSSRSIKIVVEKTRGVPLMSVKGLTKPDGTTIDFAENKNYEFEVKIIDEDAGSRAETRPRIEILGPTSTELSLAPFVKIDKVKVDMKKREFIYTMVIQIGDHPLAKSSIQAGFSLRAFSRFNTATPVHRVQGYLYPTFGSIKVTWKDKLKFVMGTEVSVPFLVYEATSRAKFTVVADGNPTGSKIECYDYDHYGIMPCVFTWKIPSNMGPAYGDFNLEITANNGYPNSPNSKTENITVYFEIDKPTLPKPPKPTPKPNPSSEPESLMEMKP